ncbi:MAG: hypothetical protein IKL79_05230 [Clostridia bacterium]|nr:hypothetical protein [Clostridia bacterium]MBR3681387.1 hypothetical protein [Clostridia bacterium]
METIRYEKFTRAIDGIHKSVNKLKIAIAPRHGVKGVHVFWIYKLLEYPEGLTAAEIASVSMIDKSLVSREIAALKRDGYIEARGAEGGKRGYNARLVLTESGVALAKSLVAEVTRIQAAVSEGISQEELAVFYSTLEKLNERFTRVTAAYSEDGED